MRPSVAVFLFGVLGCGNPVPRSPVEEPAPTVPPPSQAAAPVPEDDLVKLKAAVHPLGWSVNSSSEDDKLRFVSAFVIRSRFDKKTEEDFAKLSRALVDTGVPVIIDLGYVGTPATADWVKHVVGNRMVIGFVPGVGDKSVIPQLAQMTWLELLRLSGRDSLTDADLAPLAALTKLKSLTFTDNLSKVTRASYGILAGMKDLRTFTLPPIGFGAPHATDEDIAILAGLTKLESLSLSFDANRVTDAGLARIRSLTALRNLSLDSRNTPLAGPQTTTAFDAIGGMTELEQLTLEIVAPSEGYAKLAPLKKLRKITLKTGNYFKHEPAVNFTRHVGQLGSLEEVNLGNHTNEWTDEALEQIKGLTHLQSLDVGGSKVTDEGLKHLSGMKELIRFWCRATAITGTGLKHLAGLDKLQLLSLNMSKITDDGLSYLPALPELQWVELFQTGITDAGLKHLVKLPKLRSLQLDETGITDACVETLKQIPSLKGVNARKTKLTPAAAKALKGVGRIEWVEIGN